MALQRTGIEAMGASHVKAKEHCVCMWGGGGVSWVRREESFKIKKYIFFQIVFKYKKT